MKKLIALLLLCSMLLGVACSPKDKKDGEKSKGKSPLERQETKDLFNE